MPNYLLVVRRILREEAAYLVTAPSREEAKELFDRRWYERLYTRRPEILDEHLDHMFELPERPLPRKPRTRDKKYRDRRAI